MKLRYTPQALREINRAISYISERSPQGADNVAKRFRDVLTFLQEHPFAGESNLYRGTRRLYLKPYPYIVSYQVLEDEIVILRFRHTSRRPRKNA